MLHKTVLRYGLIGGVVLVTLGWINFFVTKDLGYSAAELGGYLSIVIALTFVFFGIRHFRDHDNEGRINFRKAVSTGLLISLIPSFFMLISTIIFMVTMGDQWTEWALENASEAQRQQMEDAPPWMFNPLFQGVVMFGTVYVIGIIASLLSALVLKREPGMA